MNLSKWMKRRVFMDAASDAGTAGGGAAAAASGDAGAGAAAGAGEAGASGAGAATSVLATGAAGAAAANTTDFIPEKLRVLKDDGTLDLDASSRKLAEAYSKAQQRIGTGDLPPGSAEEYKVEIPEAFKESWKPDEDQQFKDFRTKALESGMTQKQFDLVMSQYFEMAPKLVAGATMLDTDGARAELQKAWATEADFNRNIGNAFTAASAIAEKAGIPIDEIMAPTALGNNPMFLRLMAAIGPEFKEDRVPGGTTTAAQDDINALMVSEANLNPKHPDHEKVSAKIREHFTRKHGNKAVV